MACAIDYTEAILSGVNLTISGVATECESVTVQITDNVITGEKTGTVINGEWEVQFGINDLLNGANSFEPLTQKCGDRIKIIAYCKEGSSCVGPDVVELSCPPGHNCPSVTINITEIDECDEQQERLVKFEATVESTTAGVFEWSYGDGQSSTSAFIPPADPSTGTVIIEGEHTYQADDSDPTTFTLTLHTLFLPDLTCEESTTIVIEPCEPMIGIDCPEVTLSVTDEGRCSDDGHQTVTFNINVDNITDPTILEIDFGDGTDETIPNSEIQASGGSGISRQHTYSPGSYTIVVHVIYPEECASSNTTTIVIDCEVKCPNDVLFEISDSNGNRFRVIDNASGVYEQINDNPDNTQITCFPPGNYTVHLVDPVITGQSITWREDDDPPQPTNLTEFDVILANGVVKLINATTLVENCHPLAESVLLRACGCEETDWSEWSDCEDCIQTRQRNLADCTVQTETRPCTVEPTAWTPWSAPSWICIQTRSRRNALCIPEFQTRVDWCCIWTWINIFLAAVTAVVVFIAICMLPASFWTAVLALASGGSLSAVWAALSTINIIMLIAGAVLLVVSTISIILWLFICIFRNIGPAACRLLNRFIQFLAFFVTITGIITLGIAILSLIFCSGNPICLFQGLGCAAGGLVDLAWLGFILAVCVIIESILCNGNG